jgi:flagellar motor switch protein FliM
MTNPDSLSERAKEAIEEHIAGEVAGDKALVPSNHRFAQEPLRLSPPVSRLPVELDVSIPVRSFRVRNLLALQPGQVIETQWGQNQDLPLAAGDVQLAWSEFEVVDTKMGVRVTRLA